MNSAGGGHRSRPGVVWTTHAGRDSTGADRRDSGRVDSTPCADQGCVTRVGGAGGARGYLYTVACARSAMAMTPQAGPRSAGRLSTHSGPAPSRQTASGIGPGVTRGCPRHPQWRDARGRGPPLAGHGLGPRLELARRRRARLDLPMCETCRRSNGRSRQGVRPRQTTARHDTFWVARSTAAGCR